MQRSGGDTAPIHTWRSSNPSKSPDPSCRDGAEAQGALTFADTHRRPARLVDLAECGGLTRIGADARIFTASYAVSQRWSRAIQTHPESPDGILYRPRHDPARLAAAFFDRITEEVSAEVAGTWLDQKAVRAEVLETYGVALVS
jgi:hypothetical protein